MTEPSKMPFEPIPMPGMPALPEMPKPSFSRSTTPPAPPPVARKPLMIAEDKPHSFFLPNGIAPEAPATPPAMTAEAKPAGFPMSWLKPSRAKGVVLAGLGSLGIGAFGLNALIPMPVPEPARANTFADTAASKPTKSAPAATITEDPRVAEPPKLPTFSDRPSGGDPWLKPLPPPETIALVGDIASPPTVPPPILGEPPALPAIVPAVPPALVVPKMETSPAPAPIPLPLPALPGFGDALVLPAPLAPKADEKAILPTPPVDRALPPVRLDPTPTPVPAETVPIDKPKPLPVVAQPASAPPPEIKPLPVPDLKLIKPVETYTPPAIALTPLPSDALPVPAPVPPLPESGDAGKPAVRASVEAKTDYDVDIHKSRAGDTYNAISEKFYGSPAFANALRGFNDNADLTRTPDVQVPPIHVIKKFAAAGSSRVVPAGARAEPSPLEVQWGSPGSRKADKAKAGELQWK